MTGKFQLHVYYDKKNDNWYVIRKHSNRTIIRSKEKHVAIGKAVSQAKREGNTEVIIHERMGYNMKNIVNGKI